MCNHGYFNLKVGKGSGVWSIESCEEITPKGAKKRSLK